MRRAKRIFCVVAYDVHDDRRREQIVKQLEKYGIRVNLSVFECMFTVVQFGRIQNAIEQQINIKEDTVIYYPICMECYAKIVTQPERREKVKTVYLV